jgi:hypothetical protein
MPAASTFAMFIAPLLGAVAAKAMAPKAPKLDETPAPPVVDADANNKKAEGAADQARKRALAAAGRSDTLLTGPAGLGDVPAANQATKSLLGY